MLMVVVVFVNVVFVLVGGVCVGGGDGLVLLAVVVLS